MNPGIVFSIRNGVPTVEATTNLFAHPDLDPDAQNYPPGCEGRRVRYEVLRNNHELVERFRDAIGTSPKIASCEEVSE